MSWNIADRIQRARPSDPLLDYCHWPYEPIAEPHQRALRSSALLYHSFHVAGASDRMIEFCDRMINTWGRFNTVWGVKFSGEALSWEFYFYDYRRIDRAHGIKDFINCTRGLLNVTAPAADDRPYFMFSVEIDGRNLNDGKPVDQFDVYIGNPGSQVSSGICYGLNNDGFELRNFYFFFNALKHAQDIREKVVSNAHVPFSQLRLDDILWPEMVPQTIVVANKRHNDGLYFSRISVDNLIHFVGRLNFPTELLDFIHNNRDELAHHLWDVGYDYELGRNGEIALLKGSYYGLL